MTERLLKVLPLGVFGSLLAILTAGFSPAQEPSRSTTDAAPDPPTHARQVFQARIRSKLASNSGAAWTRATRRLPRISISKPSGLSAISFGT